MSSQVLEALSDVLDGRDEPDNALCSAVSLLAAEPGVRWAGIAFQDEGALELGPSAGDPDEARRTAVPIVFQESIVGELWVDGAADRAFLEDVAALLATHVLIGWDTQGEPWEP